MSVVFYFMDGCPACEATWPTWRKVKKEAGQTKEIESKQVPMGKNVTSFPTIVIEDENGLEVRRIEGRQTDAKALLSEIKGKKKGGRKARKTRKTRRSRRTTRRKIR